MTSEPKRMETWSRSHLIVIGMILLAAAAAMWFLQPPPKIAARTQLHIAAEPPYLLFRPEIDPAHHDAYLRSQAYFVKDRFVLSAALRDHPEIAELSILKEQADPLQWLENEITVSFPSPEVMHISLSGHRPEEQKKIVSAVTVAYLENYVNKERTEHLARRQNIQKVLFGVEGQVKRNRRALQALMARQQELKAKADNEAASIDVSELCDQIATEEELLRKARRKLLELEAEQEAPARISQPNREAVFAFEAKGSVWIAAAAAVLTGLGIFLLLLAAFTFCVHKGRVQE